MISQSKCVYYDKGFCKEKEQCSKEHPSANCDGQCTDKRTCPLRHRQLCKNGDRCIFHESDSCEFLHDTEKNSEGKNVKEIIENIETQIINLTSSNNSLESIIIDLEKENSQLKTRNNILTDKINAIDEEYSNKFEAYENMMVDKMDEINEHVSTMDITCNCSHSDIANFEFKPLDIKDPTILDDNVSAAKIDNCNEEIKFIICEKKFKYVSNLDKHGKKFHMTKEPVPR